MDLILLSFLLSVLVAIISVIAGVGGGVISVSYTHLTLPTKLEV